jgi:hypothetical protein
VIEFGEDFVAGMVRERTMSVQIPRPIGTIAFATAHLALGLASSAPANKAFAVDCLAAPNSAAPSNSHWYYRTDRTQQRQCWYLRADNEPSQQSAVQVAGETSPTKLSQSMPAAGPHSLANFKNFMAQNVGAKLSDRDVEKLYAEFLEWSRRAKN